MFKLFCVWLCLMIMAGLRMDNLEMVLRDRWTESDGQSECLIKQARILRDILIETESPELIWKCSFRIFSCNHCGNHNFVLCWCNGYASAHSVNPYSFLGRVWTVDNVLFIYTFQTVVEGERITLVVCKGYLNLLGWHHNECEEVNKGYFLDLSVCCSSKGT